MFFLENSTVRILTLETWLNMSAGRDPKYRVVLPMIQRGFIWKPNQIIDLWDSLLQGMPIGALMLSEMNTDEIHFLPLRSDDQSTTTQSPKKKALLGLTDGQQRTLAMLTGWLPQESSRCLWVDFGDEPPSGYLLRLRVTTHNHPFGFRRDNPNAKLSMDDRRCAKSAYGSKDPASFLPHPAGARYSLPVDLATLVDGWKKVKAGGWKDNDWKADIHRRIEALEILNCRRNEYKLEKYSTQNFQSIQDQIDKRIHNLAEGMERLFKAEIPLLRVDPAFFKVERTDDVEPPLARLFKRIGSNATPLSNADYVYSVLKHMVPEVHDMVEVLYAQSNVASLMTETDLVMSALRLSATEWEKEIDRDNPSKEDFHRMIWPNNDKDGETAKQRQDFLVEMLADSSEKTPTLSRYFTIVQENLEYSEEWEYGLPKHMFHYLGRPLVQILLRLAQIEYIKHPATDDSRFEVLRLVLWWTQWVTDKPKASRIAFQAIKKSTEHVDMGQKIAEAIISEGAGMRIWSPEEIKAIGVNATPEGDNQLHGQSRFGTSPSDKEESRQVREFYRFWWRSWNYHHPILLWLQRGYVNKLEGNPMAGTDEDTPYDFDHILPYAQWGGWTGVAGNARLLDFVLKSDRHAHEVIGNGIGNVRVAHFSDNRHDGDASPKLKMGENKEDQKTWMENSAISEDQLPLWQDCSPADENNKKQWTLDRALAFQRAVENRAFDLYQRLYNDAGFANWLSLASKTSDPQQTTATANPLNS